MVGSSATPRIDEAEPLACAFIGVIFSRFHCVSVVDPYI
jgi:hypothetical protein